MVTRRLAPLRAAGSTTVAAAVVGAAAFIVWGCAGVRGGDDPGSGNTGNGNGTGNSSGNGKGGSGGQGVDPGQGTGVCGQEVLATIRDFRGFTVDPSLPRHPDFEYNVGPLTGIVKARIGADQKPVYAPDGPTSSTNGAAYFNQWYRDVDGVNIRFDKVSIALTADPSRQGVYLYDSDAFFPIDNQGWGNQYQGHNYDFTTEIHFNFPYHGGEVFTFRGDDDVWVFVNGNLAIDLGGVHEAETGSVDLDQMASALGITVGKTYRMDIFQAERHVIGSTFHIETTLACIDNIIVP
jgi:fibro-slime domain-containing protein